MKTNLTVLCFVLLILMPVFSFAGVDLPWSTTFNCAEALQPTTGNLCDGVEDGPSWGYYCDGNNTYKAGITATANNPNGGGGKGARFWVGDGTNSDSGTLGIVFTSAQPEFWIRWYARYQAGFAWTNIGYDKLLYIHTDQGTDAIIHLYEIDGLHIYTQGVSPNPEAGCSGCGWQTIMGGLTSDGLWHCYEIHIKMDTNSEDGIAEMWVDGNLKFSKTDMYYGTKTGWKWFHFKSNQATPNNAGCVPVDYDDMAISKTGYIGPIGNKPSPPKGLKIVQ